MRAVLQVCRDLGSEVIAEGVGTKEELRWLRRCGVVLFQGYMFARPGFEALPVGLVCAPPCCGRRRQKTDPDLLDWELHCSCEVPADAIHDRRAREEVLG